MAEWQQIPSVTEVAQGYMANMDLEDEEERERLEDVAARVEANNRRVWERIKAKRR